MKEELDLEEKTDVELVGVPTEEAAGSPGAEEAEPGGLLILLLLSLILVLLYI